MLHKNMTPTDGIHVIYAWTVADATALAALTLASTDIGKVAFQQDIKAAFVLVDNATPTWSRLNHDTTDDLTEGSTNKYFTAARVLATVLTGLSTTAGTVVDATHTILQAIGFLQKQVSDNTAAITAINAKSLKEFLPIACGDETTAITTGVKVTFQSPPYGMTLNEIDAFLVTAQASGTIFTVDFKVGGVSVFTTKPTIDNTEQSTSTAVTAAVLDGTKTAIAANSICTAEVNQIGDGTAKGLKMNIVWTKT